MADAIRVVIVDDERLFAELMRVALRAADGIEVLAVVHDVKSAIAALNEHRPDVVIADYHLPVGHMTKGRGLTEVVESVRAAAAGEILFAPGELQRLLLESAASRKIVEPLTARELEVLRLLASGTSTMAAAESLGISTATLRAHVQAVLRKLGAHSRLEAVAEAARLGLVTLESWTRDRIGPPRGGSGESPERS